MQTNTMIILTPFLIHYPKISIHQNIIWTILSLKDTKCLFLHLRDRLNTSNITQKLKYVPGHLLIQTSGLVYSIQNPITIMKPDNQYLILAKLPVICSV